MATLRTAIHLLLTYLLTVLLCIDADLHVDVLMMMMMMMMMVSQLTVTVLTVDLSRHSYCRAVAPTGGKLPPYGCASKNYVMCVLSLSWNFSVTHDKYIARPSSKEPR